MEWIEILNRLLINILSFFTQVHFVVVIQYTYCIYQYIYCYSVNVNLSSCHWALGKLFDSLKDVQ